MKQLTLRVISYLLLFLPGLGSGYTTFFYYPTGCTGNRYEFNAVTFGRCYTLPNGYARSIYDTNTNPCVFIVGFRPSSANPSCGLSVCSIYYPNHCCSSNQQNIKGLTVYIGGRKMSKRALEERAKCPGVAESHRGEVSLLERSVETSVATNSTGCIDVSTVGGRLQVMIAPEEYVSVPNPHNRIPTQEEIHSALVEAGHAHSAHELARGAFLDVTGGRQH